MSLFLGDPKTQEVLHSASSEELGYNEEAAKVLEEISQSHPMVVDSETGQPCSILDMMWKDLFKAIRIHYPKLEDNVSISVQTMMTIFGLLVTGRKSIFATLSEAESDKRLNYFGNCILYALGITGTSLENANIEIVQRIRTIGRVIANYKG